MPKAGFHDNVAVPEEILDRARYGHLAVVDQDGCPRALPLNFLRRKSYLYFQGSPEEMLAEHIGALVSFTALDMASWIPSTWADPSNAGQANTFYRSVFVQGELEAVHDLRLKAAVLEGFLTKYQPEDEQQVHADATAPLATLAISRLAIEHAMAKVQMGQHLDSEKRSKVLDGLRARGRAEDRWVALEMLRLNQDPRAAEPTKDEIRWVEDPREIPFDQLCSLLNDTYWAHDRPAYEIACQMSDAVLTLAALKGDRLVSYARVTSVARKTGYLFDVVVHPDERGQGLGYQLMQRLMQHPSVTVLGRILLDTRDAMALYRKFGFIDLARTTRNGGSTIMAGGSAAGQILHL